MCIINNLLLILFPLVNNFYMLRYGHLLMNYYNEESCTNNFTQIVYSVIDEDKLKILNASGETKNYSYSFNYFASQIYYNNVEEEDEEEDSQDGGAFVCNGACYKRASNSDILIEPNTENDYSYSELNDKYKAFSCIYNNIIIKSTIDIIRYSDKKCKNKLGNDYHFTGTDFCWKIDENYSFRPLYYEDDEDKIYYHAYNSFNCTSAFFDYFVLNENYLICNSKCQKDRTDSEKSYKCTFKANTEFLNKSKILFRLLISLIFNLL